MRIMLRTAAVALVLATEIAFAAAQTGGLTEQGTALQLTPQQRVAIYRAVTKDKLRTPPPPNLPLAVGAQIPAMTELYTLPDAITADAPSAKFYKYTVAQNQVVIVDPTTLKVIDVIHP
jgi:hypothetical protein